MFNKVVSWGRYCSTTFVNDLPSVVKFGELFLFADDFKLLEQGNLEIQSDLKPFARWVKEKRMEPAPDTCPQLVINGRIPRFRLPGGPL